ncbi:MAG: gliding motility-associated C-terminal domain-containing protein [Bacteroidales bacterium]|jgi:gliding motility-associated-like protein|nr:gliding motility-associated C-terminal domain-containing protein [Bacteroidales bacterium]
MKTSVKLIIYFSGIFIPSIAYGQLTCPNLNFTYANFTNWECYAGSCSNGSNINPSPPMGGRHTIMDAAALTLANQLMDERCIVIPKVPTGFAYSIRLGNDNTGSEMEAIEYTMSVDSTNSLLILHFAWIMEDPSHAPYEQPQFTMTLKDSLGRVLDIPCGSVNFIAGAGLTGLVCDGTVQARTWTTVGFSLETLIGQTIKIYYETRDCTLSGHFGYAYLVGECRPMKIDLQFCEGQTAARLRAPEGFVWYKWTRSSQPGWVYEGSGRAYQTYVCPDPQDEEIFTCEVRSELGCTSTLRTVIARTDIDADFMFGVMDEKGEVNFPDHDYKSWYDTCNRTVTFVDLSTVINSTKASILWEIAGTNAVSSDSLFTYTFPDPDVPTQYLVRLTVTAENNCIDTSAALEDMHITIYPSPKIKIEGVEQMCAGDQKVLRATTVVSEFVNYRWSWEDTSGNIQTSTADTLLISGPGEYRVEATDIKGCIARDTHLVTTLQPQLENLNIKDVSCFGYSDGAFSHGAITGGVPPYQSAYWQFPDEDTTRPGNTKSGAYTNLKAGTYIFGAIDAIGCELHGEITIKEPFLLEISGTQYPTTCGSDNGRLKIKTTGGTPPYNYEILKQKDGQQIALSDSVSNLSAENYIVKVTDANKCFAEDTIAVTALPIPRIAVDLNEWAKCGDTNGAIRIRPIDAYQPVKLTWTPGRPGDTSNAISYLAPGEYKVAMTDANGCQTDTTIVVEAYPMPEITIEKTPETCHREDGSISITMNSQFPHTIKYVWEGRADTTSVLTRLKAGTYKVRISDTLCFAEQSIVIEHVDGPIANFEANSYNVATNARVTLTDISKGSVNKWDWDMGDNNRQSGKIVYYTYDISGDYSIVLKVTDTNACTDTLSKMIHIYDELNVFVPNTFTPNGDSINDTWKPIMSEYAKGGYQLSVFDRWGERIFYTTDTEAVWDGTVKGKFVEPNSMYSYRIIVYDFTGQAYEFVGEITVIR